MDGERTMKYRRTGHAALRVGNRTTSFISERSTFSESHYRSLGGSLFKVQWLLTLLLGAVESVGVERYKTCSFSSTLSLSFAKI